MAQHIFYNGTRLDTYDGTTGVIIGQVQHDSSPSMELSASPNARANGTTFHQLRTRARTISIAGSIVGTDSNDLEQRIDAFKHLVSQREGELKITEYGTFEYRVATFEDGEDWSDSPSYDFTNYSIGTRSIRLVGTNVAPASTTWEAVHDLSTFADDDTVKLWAYVDDAAKFGSIVVEFLTGSDAYTATWTGLVTGANELSLQRSALAASGTPLWSAVTSIRLTVAGSGADPVTVSVDDLRLSTTKEARIYTVSLSREVSIPREHYQTHAVDFSIDFVSSDGIGRSDKVVTITPPTVACDEVRIPRYLGGSGDQSVQLRINNFSLDPIAVTDHFVDRFTRGSSVLGDVYHLSGSWTVNDYEGYRHCLKSTADASASTAAIRNLSMKNGEIIALLQAGDAVGLFARASNAADPFADAYVDAQTGSGGVTTTFSATDSRFLDIITYKNLVTNWVWVRLVCDGPTIRVFYRGINQDTWTKALEQTTAVISAGSWGVYAAPGSVIRCAHLEVIDYADEKSNTLTVRPIDDSIYRVFVDSRDLLASGSQGTLPTTGSFPVVTSGMNRIGAHIPADRLGAGLFYRLPEYMNETHRIGGPSGYKQAYIFNTGESGHIRRRGTFVYITRTNGQMTGGFTRGNVHVSIQTVSGGNPTGTIVANVNGDDGPYVIEERLVNSYLPSSDSVTFNSSIVPVEIVWGADVPVTPNTNYALVLETDPTDTYSAYQIPAHDPVIPGTLNTRTWDGSSWAASLWGGFAILAGDNTDSEAQTWNATLSYSPTYL